MLNRHRMKILYAIQGTGNGHVSRAREIIPLLQQYGELDILLSGTQVDVGLQQTVKYRFHGFSFIFGRRGGVDFYGTWKNMDMACFRRQMKSLPLDEYNLIINDFEPICAWACKLQNRESVALSHQAAFISPHVPRPPGSNWGQFILKHYAPTTQHVGFHFHRYDGHIHTPVIRSEIRSLKTRNDGHYTVYLPALADKIVLAMLRQFPAIKWEVFSKHASHTYTQGNIRVMPVHNDAFISSLSACEGLFTGGGFEGPAEALFFGKKLLVAPMRAQYEQQCNAYALEQLGIPVIWPDTKDWLACIRRFVGTRQAVHFDFPDETAAIVDRLVRDFSR